MANQLGEPGAEGGFATSEVDLEEAGLGDEGDQADRVALGEIGGTLERKVAKQKPQLMLHDFQRW
jgi:hypothetical protein